MFEFIQRYEDPPKTLCVVCNTESLVENKIPLSSFQLVGGGWYKTGGY
jgi:predicted nucleic acid-binding Zn ribbon protein